jgi:hypothetical protein
MLSSIRTAIRRIYGDELPSIESWAFRHKDRCKPDEIIAAAIVQSIAKDFGDWEFYAHSCYGSKPTDWDAPKYAIVDRRLVNKTKGLALYYLRDYSNGKYFRKNFYINGTQIADYCGDAIMNRYDEVEKRVTAVKQAEAKALADMKRNEDAWNLAESLLGMKRNEYGALVPVQTAE